MARTRYQNKAAYFPDPSVEQGHQAVVKTGIKSKQWLSPAQRAAKEAGRKRYEQQQHQVEKDRVLEHVSSQPRKTNSRAPKHDCVFLDGITFRVTKGGNKLVRDIGKRELFANLIPQMECSKSTDDRQSSHIPTPRDSNVGGVSFRRTKNGNLVRAMGVTKGLVQI